MTEHVEAGKLTKLVPAKLTAKPSEGILSWANITSTEVYHAVVVKRGARLKVGSRMKVGDATKVFLTLVANPKRGVLLTDNIVTKSEEANRDL